jgi:gag-polypeptide of LTR copia-type
MTGADSTTTSGGTTVSSIGTSSGTGDTSIHVVVFSGKKEDWETWKEKFMVKASMRGYEEILLGEVGIPKTHKEDGTKVTLSSDDQAIANANKKCFGDLVLSIDCTTAAGKVAFAMIKATKTKTNPSGDLRAAYLRLKSKYEPSTTPQLMKLTKEFHSKSLQTNQDPDQFITDLEALKVKMEELDHVITDKSMIIHILNNLDTNYEMEVKMLEHEMQRLKEINKEISIETVRQELNLRYERLKKNSKQPVEHEFYMGGKFKGKCNHCGKIGHKAVECRLRINTKPRDGNPRSDVVDRIIILNQVNLQIKIENPCSVHIVIIKGMMFQSVVKRNVRKELR